MTTIRGLSSGGSTCRELGMGFEFEPQKGRDLGSTRIHQCAFLIKARERRNTRKCENNLNNFPNIFARAFPSSPPFFWFSVPEMIMRPLKNNHFLAEGWPTVVAMTDMHWHSKLILISDTRASDTFPSFWVSAFRRPAEKITRNYFQNIYFVCDSRRKGTGQWWCLGLELGMGTGVGSGPNWHPVTGQDIKWNDACVRRSGLSN